VLPSSYFLRFVPAADYNGTPGSLTVRLSDGSTGAIAFSASSNISAAIGGTGNWSSATVALGTSVTPVNDAPTATITPATYAAAEQTGLTDREQQVLAGLVQGHTYQVIADLHHLSIDTIRSHVKSIYRKLQVNSKAEAVAVALRNKLV